MIVWLWDAIGPASDASGITDDETRARRTAEAYMVATMASTARVESASAAIGIYSLTSGYKRTGKGWKAKKHRDGLIKWTKFFDHEIDKS